MGLTNLKYLEGTNCPQGLTNLKYLAKTLQLEWKEELKYHEEKLKFNPFLDRTGFIGFLKFSSEIHIYMYIVNYRCHVTNMYAIISHETCKHTFRPSKP